MEKKKTKLLIVEDTREMCDILQNFFLMIRDIELCGIANDGEEALQKIREEAPDVVLLDIIMPKLDGISVLEKLHLEPPAKMPHIIITSAIGQEKITNTALLLGASYYMIKPYSLSDLLQRIYLIANMPVQHSSFSVCTEMQGSTEDKNLDRIIRQTLIDLGVPTHILGYKYMIEALHIIIHEDKPCFITKQVYAIIAEHNGTAVECVESALRKTVRRIYQSNNTFFQEVMKSSSNDNVKQPSNSKFLTLLAERIKLAYH